MKKKVQQIIERINQQKPVFSALFTFRIKQRDATFDRFNERIDALADSSPGYLGKERWVNDEENKKSVVYYWDNLQALKKFSNHPDHQKAKQQYKHWYSGYEILIAEVIKYKTDGGL